MMKRGTVRPEQLAKRTKHAPYQDALDLFTLAHDVEDLDPLACKELDIAAARLWEANALYSKPADTNLADWDVEYTAAAVKDSFSFIAVALQAAKDTLPNEFTEWSIELTSTTMVYDNSEDPHVWVDTQKPRLQLKIYGHEGMDIESSAVYCFVENKVLPESETGRQWASEFLDRINGTYNAADAAEKNVMLQKCLGYSKFIKSVRKWTNDFNSNPRSKGKFSARYITMSVDREVYDDLYSSFGTQNVRIFVQTPEGDEAVYKFILDYFVHTVEDASFFHTSSLEASKLSKVFIKDCYEPRNKLPRTLLGMLSTWNKYFSTLGLEDMTWITRKPWWDQGAVPPRAIVLEDVWASGPINSYIRSKGMSTAMEVYELLEQAGYDRSELRDALEVYDSLKRKAKRHGREFNLNLRKLIKDEGYYGLIATGGLRHVKMTEGNYPRNNPKAFRALEVTCAVCDACV